MRWPSFACACALLAAAPVMAAEPDVFGLWATARNNGRVLIEQCGAALCGRVMDGNALRAHADQADVKNPDPSKRSRRIRGLRILDGYRGGPQQWQGGTIYDPQTGDETGDSTLTLLGPDRLKVRGCRYLFCRSEIWTRVRQ